MRSWMEGFQDSIDLMEITLTDEPDIETIAGKAALSPFYYQRIFSALCNGYSSIETKLQAGSVDNP